MNCVKQKGVKTTSSRLVREIKRYLREGNTLEDLHVHSRISMSKLKRYQQGIIPRSIEDQSKLAIVLGLPEKYFNVKQNGIGGKRKAHIKTKNIKRKQMSLFDVTDYDGEQKAKENLVDSISKDIKDLSLRDLKIISIQVQAMKCNK